MVLNIFFAIASLGIAVFALFELKIVLGYWRTRARTGAGGNVQFPVVKATRVPTVTVQLPIYNDPQVALDLIRAVSQFDYPRDRMKIQILDDSTDETPALIGDFLSSLDRRGLDISHVRRAERVGYKAGALAHGMTLGDSDFFAIFDSDFLPPKDFLRRVLIDENMFADGGVAFVQGRWTFYNLDQNLLTRLQSILIDRHFVVQKPYQVKTQRTLFFNGSGGIWRRSAVEAAGGWSADTLSEDLDLSYRCALLGYSGRYDSTLTCPSEIPPSLQSFKLQQRRWAKGSAQCMIKLLPDVLACDRLKHRADDVHAMAGYLIHPLLLVYVLAWPWVVLQNTSPLFLWICQIGLVLGNLAAIAGFLSTYLVRGGKKKGLSMGVEILASMVLGITMMVNNTVAFFSGLFVAKGEFERTPKTGRASTGQVGKMRRIPLHWTFFFETALAGYGLVAASVMFQRGYAFEAQQSLLLGLAMLAMVAVQLRRPKTPQVQPIANPLLGET